MPKRIKPKRDKPHRPRDVLRIGGLQVVVNKHHRAENARPLTDADATDLHTAYLLALDNMVRGEATEQDWATVVVALNTGMVLSERGIGPEYDQTFVFALDGAFRTKLRAARHGAWRFDGESLQAVREAIDVHQSQTDHTTKQELRLAIQEVHRRMAEGNVYQEAA